MTPILTGIDRSYFFGKNYYNRSVAAGGSVTLNVESSSKFVMTIKDPKKQIWFLPADLASMKNGWCLSRTQTYKNMNITTIL